MSGLLPYINQYLGSFLLRVSLNGDDQRVMDNKRVFLIDIDIYSLSR